MVLQTDNRNGWFWYIPQHDDIVIGRHRRAVRLPVQGPRREPREDVPRGGRALPGGRRSASPVRRGRPATSSPVTTPTGRRRVAGDGWVLVGDAFGFLDPLYSSGVLLALKSGELAADAIVEGLERGRHQRGAARPVGAELQPGRRSHAAAGVRVLRRVQLRRVRPQVSAAARHDHRPADRRSVHRSRRCGLGPDGIALQAG